MAGVEKGVCHCLRFAEVQDYYSLFGVVGVRYFLFCLCIVGFLTSLVCGADYTWGGAGSVSSPENWDSALNSESSHWQNASAPVLPLFPDQREHAAPNPRSQRTETVD